jgi:hypothetical protein
LENNDEAKTAKGAVQGLLTRVSESNPTGVLILTDDGKGRIGVFHNLSIQGLCTMERMLRVQVDLAIGIRAEPQKPKPSLIDRFPGSA